MSTPRPTQDPKLVTRLDTLLSGPATGFYNPVTGFGTGRDKTVYTAFASIKPLDTDTLSGLYHGHDLSARVIDVIPDEELRLPFTVQVDTNGDRAAENTVELLVKREFKRLKVRENLLLGRKWGRCFGGAATILGASDGRPASWPLDVASVQRIDWIRTLDRRYLWPNTWYTSGPKNGQPETYYLSDTHPGGSESFVIHESRLILWPGETTATREKELNNSWDHSVLDRLWTVLRMFETLYKGVELLITDGPQAVYKVQGLVEKIAEGAEEEIQARFDLIDSMRSILRAIVIDSGGNESFERQQVTYSGTPEILTQMQLRLSAATQIPMMVLFGQAPGGLGVTGENDLRWFFDRTASSQRNVLAPRIEQIADLILTVNGYGQYAGLCEVEFEQLWTPTALEQAQERLAQAQTDQIYITNNVLAAEEVALSRFLDKGKWSPAWTAVSRETREKMLKEVLANIEEGGLRQGGEVQADQQQQQQQPTAGTTRVDFDPDQPRDEDGQWTTAGASAVRAAKIEHYRGRVAKISEKKKNPEKYLPKMRVRLAIADAAKEAVDTVAAKAGDAWNEDVEADAYKLVSDYVSKPQVLRRYAKEPGNYAAQAALLMQPKIKEALKTVDRKMQHKVDLSLTLYEMARVVSGELWGTKPRAAQPRVRL